MVGYLFQFASQYHVVSVRPLLLFGVVLQHSRQQTATPFSHLFSSRQIGESISTAYFLPAKLTSRFLLPISEGRRRTDDFETESRE